MFKITDIILNKRFFFFRFQVKNYSVDAFILRFGNDVLPAISQIHRFCFDIDRSKDSKAHAGKHFEWIKKNGMTKGEEEEWIDGWKQASMRKKTTRKNCWWISLMKNENEERKNTVWMVFLAHHFVVLTIQVCLVH